MACIGTSWQTGHSPRPVHVESGSVGASFASHTARPHGPHTHPSTAGIERRSIRRQRTTKVQTAEGIRWPQGVSKCDAGACPQIMHKLPFVRGVYSSSRASAASCAATSKALLIRADASPRRFRSVATHRFLGRQRQRAARQRRIVRLRSGARFKMHNLGRHVLFVSRGEEAQPFHPRRCAA